ncbi:STT3 domain-containing protein [Nanoarchaeota archaeon]
MEEEKKKNKETFKPKSEEGDSSEVRENIVKIVKNNKQFLTYLGGLIILLWFTISIRLKNLPLLGKLPQALDPFVFLRYAQDIVAQGSLYAVDTLRYFPVGAPTGQENIFLSYFVAWFYKIVHIFFPSVTLDFIHNIYPVVTFGIGLLFFFLLVRRLFHAKIALVASLFLGIAPAFLHRTTAGFADKESLALMLFFIGLYLFVLGYQSKTIKNSIIFGSLSGLFIGLMGLSWGGVNIAFLIIAMTSFVVFIFNKLNKKYLFTYASWLFFTFLMLSVFTIKYGGIKGLIISTTSGLAFFVLILIVIHYLLFDKKWIEKIKLKINLPKQVTTLLLTLIIGIIIISTLFGPMFFVSKVDETYKGFVLGLSGSRHAQTVAENRQPFFTGEWVQNFGPHNFGIMWFFSGYVLEDGRTLTQGEYINRVYQNIFGVRNQPAYPSGWSIIPFIFSPLLIILLYLEIPLFFLLFFIGSIILFYFLIKPLKKYTKELTIAYGLLTAGLIFSKISADSILDGRSGFSIFLYIASLIGLFLLIAIIYIYFYFQERKVFDRFKNIETDYILIFVWFILTMIIIRGGGRLMIMAGPITAIIAAYFCFVTIKYITDKFYSQSYSYHFLVFSILTVIFTYLMVNTTAVGMRYFYFILYIILIVSSLALFLWKYFDDFKLSYKSIFTKKRSELIWRNLLYLAFIFMIFFIIANFCVVAIVQTAGSGRPEGGYTKQWEQAMEWVDNNLPENAVFAHWWDYGYWVQSGGNRATILDGGNWIPYWNYLMGRHVLTTPDDQKAIEFLKMHNGTHLLIVKEEIGKVTAYSSIGSDETYDRFTWISGFGKVADATREIANNEIMFTFQGNLILDGDFEYNKMDYPGGAYLGYNFGLEVNNIVVGIILGVEVPVKIENIEINNQTIEVTTPGQPNIIIAKMKQGRLLENTQQSVPLECLYYNGKLYSNETVPGFVEKQGYKGCFRLTPRMSLIDQNGNFVITDPMEMGYMISERGRASLWVRLYLLDEPNEYFKLVYPNDNYPSYPINHAPGVMAPNELGNLDGIGIGPLRIYEVVYPEDYTVDSIDPEWQERFNMTTFPVNISRRALQ